VVTNEQKVIMAVLPPAVFKRLGSRLGPAARLSGGLDPADGAATAAGSVSDGALAGDSVGAMPGALVSSAADTGPAAAAADQFRTPDTADSSTDPVHGSQLMAAAAAISTPLSGIGGAALSASGAGPAAAHIQPPARPALSPVGEDGEEEETVPLGHNPLARRVLAGRQSLAPSRQVRTSSAVMLT
jgi:hypothetical protein